MHITDNFLSVRFIPSHPTSIEDRQSRSRIAILANSVDLLVHHLILLKITYHTNGICYTNYTQHHSSIVFGITFLCHVLSQIEVRYNEPDEQYQCAQTQKVECHLLEQSHIEHIGQTIYTIFVPFLENSN